MSKNVNLLTLSHAEPRVSQYIVEFHMNDCF
jgi:hypothetical protein